MNAILLTVGAALLFTLGWCAGYWDCSHTLRHAIEDELGRRREEIDLGPDE